MTDTMPPDLVAPGDDKGLPYADGSGGDAPSSISTTYTVPVGGSVTGDVTRADSDVYRVELVAGSQYTFTANNTIAANHSALDPLLVLRDFTGGDVEYDDDSGGSFNASIAVTAQVTGTYYLEVLQVGSANTLSYTLSATLTALPPSGDSVSADTSTGASLAIGGSVDSAIDVIRDSDWRQVTLTSGHSYQFDLTGSGGLDAFVAVYGSDGKVSAYNDDGGPGLDASVRYTPTVSGTYYVAASGFDNSTGNYHLAAAEVAPQNPLDTIDAGVEFSGHTVNVYFATAGETFAGEATSVSWVDPVKTFAMMAIRTYSAVANLTFNEVSSAAQADFVMVLDPDLDAAGVTSLGSPTVIRINPYDDQHQSFMFQGGDSYLTVIHEIGHALGLAHPHDDSGSSEVMEGVTQEYGSYGAAGLNQGVFTAMSYNDGYPSVSVGQATLNNNNAATPMPLDVAVIQQKYGAVAANAGDTLYSIGGSGYRVIWDTGGTDMIGAVGGGGFVIDLRAATLQNAPGGGGYVSYDKSGAIKGGLVIAAGVVIENAAGGSGADTIIGNSASNSLYGGGGADSFDGGDGNDIVDLYNMGSGVNIDLTITGVQSGGVTLTNVESLRGTFSNDVLSGTAGANSLYGNDGNDQLFGGDGNDVLDGGLGTDQLFGGSGSDYAGFFNVVATQGGVSVSLAASGPQTVKSGVTVTLSSIENLMGTAGNDDLLGDDGDNIIKTMGSKYAGASDIAEGGLGNDILDNTPGDNSIIGVRGLVSYAHAPSAVHVSLAVTGSQDTGGEGVDTLINFDNLRGSAFDDLLAGNAGANTLDGGNGSDTVTYVEASSFVTVSLTASGSQATQGAGTDSLISIENLVGSAFNDTLTGNAANNVLTGNAGNDQLLGGLGSDVLYGQTGDDVLRDGGETANRDFLYGGSGNDAYYVTSAYTAPAEDLVFEGGTNPDLMAGVGDVDIIHSGGDFFWDFFSVGETLYNDAATGSPLLVAGKDVLNKTIYGGAGNDRVVTYGHNSVVDLGAGTDAVDFGSYGLDSSYNGQNSLIMRPGTGTDYIYNFHSGTDKLDLTAFHFGITGAQVLAQAVNVDNPGTANDYSYFYLTNAGGVNNFVVFIGLLGSQLQAGDFLT